MARYLTRLAYRYPSPIDLYAAIFRDVRRRKRYFLKLVFTSVIIFTLLASPFAYSAQPSFASPASTIAGAIANTANTEVPGDGASGSDGAGRAGTENTSHDVLSAGAVSPIQSVNSHIASTLDAFELNTARTLNGIRFISTSLIASYISKVTHVFGADLINGINGFSPGKGNNTGKGGLGAAPSVPAAVVPGWIASPGEYAVVSGTVPIVLTASVTLSQGVVVYWPVITPTTVITLATLTGPIPGGSTLTNLDATRIVNGSYIIQLDGTDTSNNHQVSQVMVSAAGDNKSGRVTFAQTDLIVPVTGFPIDVGRRYDSLNRNTVGDFGNGWSLVVGSPAVQYVTETARLALNMPNGRRATFLPGLSCHFGFCSVIYGPEPGVYGSLTTTDTDCQYVVYSPGNGYQCVGGSNFYYPDTLSYTDPYGRVYNLSRQETSDKYSLDSVQDLNNNTIIFSSNGITSTTSSLSVPFLRDNMGRITRITDTLGSPIVYSYTVGGDLSNVTYRGLTTTIAISFTYDTGHRFLQLQDPRGNRPIITTYFPDPDGRLATVTDALSNTTSYTYTADLTSTTTIVTNPDGGVERLQRDNYGSLLRETDPLSRTTVYTYDGNHNLIRMMDPLSNTTVYTYDVNGFQSGIQDPLGNVTSYTYNAYGAPTTIVNALGTQWTITNNAASLPITVTDNLGNLGGYTYDSYGNPASRYDGNGQYTTFGYDTYGNVLTETNPLSQSTHYTYDLLGRKLTTTDPENYTTTYQYDPLGHMLTITNALGYATTYSYDFGGNKVSERSPEGRTTTYSYDAANQLTMTTFPDSTYITTTYNFRGQPVLTRDQGGRITHNVYDLAGQLTSVTYAEGTADAATTSYTYDAAGRKITETDPRVYTTTYQYDNAGKLRYVTDPLSDITEYKYNAAGWLTQTVDAEGHPITNTYDIRGRPSATTYQDGTSTGTSYDGAGNTVVITDQAGLPTRYRYDNASRLTVVTNTLNYTTTYGYYPDGQLNYVRDGKDHQTTFTYDAIDRLTQKQFPDNSFETYGYDHDGNLTSEGKADRVITNTYQYDSMNRLSRANYGDGSVMTYTYTLSGQRASTNDGTLEMDYGYDNRDRLTSFNRSDNPIPQYLINYTYDADGNRTSMTVLGGGQLTYSYDNADRLSTLYDYQGSKTKYTYNKVGLPTKVQTPNGMTAQYTYDQLNRLTNITDTVGVQLKAAYTYTLGLAGNRTRVDEGDGASTSSINWDYDNGYRLITETRRNSLGTPVLTDTFSYDAANNRQTSSVNGSTTNYTYNNLDQLTGTSGAQSATYNYDGRGNLITATVGSNVTTYTYDAQDRMTSALLPGGSSVSYGYDAAGNRIKQTVGSSVTNYLWDQASSYGNVVRETDGTGAVLASYVLGGAGYSQLLEQARGGTTSYYLLDGQVNVRALTNGSGTITDRYTYNAYGTVYTSTGTTTNPYLYTSQQYDSLTGLYYLRARYYNPGVGDFVSRDTAKVDLFNPIELNRYAYVIDNPINLWDPTGHQDEVEYALLLRLAAIEALFGATYSAAQGADQAYRLVTEVIERSDTRVQVDTSTETDQEPESQKQDPTLPRNDSKGCDPIECMRWKATLQARSARLPIPGGGPQLDEARAYQIRVAGATEYLATGGGTQIWADNIDCATCSLIDAKYASPTRSPFIPGSGFPPFITGPSDDLIREISRYTAVLLDPANRARVVALEIRTNDARAVPYLQSFLANTPNGRCVHFP
jgi:RHS repeat-associated protein